MRAGNEKYQPVPGLEVPRFAGLATFMRLPHVRLEDAGDVDIGLIGVPWDGGTTNRPGPRHGPRQMRDMSAMIRAAHHAHRLSPFTLANIADLGDAPVNPADLMDSLARIEAHFRAVAGLGIRPVSAGGDHLCSLPILRALAAERPVGLIQFDAHSDLWDSYFHGSKYTHGTPFMRAIEEGLIEPKRSVQIGLRGSIYDFSDREFGAAQGMTMIDIEEVEARGVEAVMDQAVAVLGDGPVYVSFDIDCLDPAFAPGTGTPEIGGLTNREAQRMLRRLRGLDIVGADVVEVSPPFDPSGYTALNGVTMMFELICLMAERVAGGTAQAGA